MDAVRVLVGANSCEMKQLHSKADPQALNWPEAKLGRFCGTATTDQK